MSKIFWHVWCILYNKLLCWISDSDSVYFSVYGNTGSIYFWEFFDPPNRKCSIPQIGNFPRSVNTFRIGDFGGFLILTGPLTTHDYHQQQAPQICHFWIFGIVGKIRKGILMFFGRVSQVILSWAGDTEPPTQFGGIPTMWILCE